MNYLERFSQADQVRLAEISKLIRFSESNWQKFLTYIYEIIRRENVDLGKIIMSLPLEKIIQDKNIQGKEKSKTILQYLFARRFPLTDELIKTGKYKL